MEIYRSQWENMRGEIGSSNSIQHSGGYSVKYRSLNTVTNGEGMCLAGAIFQFSFLIFLFLRNGIHK